MKNALFIATFQSLFDHCSSELVLINLIEWNRCLVKTCVKICGCLSTVLHLTSSWRQNWKQLWSRMEMWGWSFRVNACVMCTCPSRSAWLFYWCLLDRGFVVCISTFPPVALVLQEIWLQIEGCRPPDPLYHGLCENVRQVHSYLDDFLCRNDAFQIGSPTTYQCDRHRWDRVSCSVLRRSRFQFYNHRHPSVWSWYSFWRYW